MTLCLPSYLQKVKSRSFPLKSTMKVWDIVIVQENIPPQQAAFSMGLWLFEKSK